MNIFYFYDCPVLSAQAQPDKMLVKMPLETAQMLCTAHRELDGDEYADEVGLYKRAYWNHPCTVWARECSANYFWFIHIYNKLQGKYTFVVCLLIKKLLNLFCLKSLHLLRFGGLKTDLKT